ncbi:MAG TPA: SRPBCC family protein [Solirubrobacteraceae bacterium]
MASWRREALIEAPVEEVWELIGDPRRHPEWFPMVVNVEGLEDLRQDATYRQVTRAIGGKLETTYAIEDLDDMREIKVRCTDTGTYVRWLLAPAQENTFADIEIGFEPRTVIVRLADATVGRRYCRRWTEEAIEGLQAAVTPDAPPSGAPASRRPTTP